MQLSFNAIEKPKNQHGGVLRKGKRKIARPIAIKKAMHVVLRAKQSRMHHRAAAIQSCLQKVSRECDVKIYEFSNNANHLHFLLRAKHRDGFKRFLRAFAGRVAQLVTGAQKGRKSESSFWELPPFTRIVTWGQAFRTAKAYVIQNFLEAEGIITYQRRGWRRACTNGSRNNPSR